MLKELRSKVPLEIRSNSIEDEYLEGVIQAKDMPVLNSILEKHLGHPLKKAGKSVSFKGEVLEVIDRIGGIRGDQTFYFCKKDDAVYFAALWPWQSDPMRVTIKAGIIKT